MSHTAHIPSHRKPRRSSSKLALRAGVAGGVLSTIAVASGAGPATAEPVTETIEMPTLTSGLSAAVAQSAEATQQVALDLELQAQEDAAAAQAAQTAKKAKAEADRRAEAKKRSAAEAEKRASRSSERTTLSAPSSSTSTNATGSAASVIAFARAQLDDAYVLGATGPNSWDCSSLLQAAFRTVGVDLPRVSQDQSAVGTPVSLSDLKPGDILYWGAAGDAWHTAVYSGDGKFIGAQNPSTGIVERSLDWDPPTGAVRVL